MSTTVMQLEKVLHVHLVKFPSLYDTPGSGLLSIASSLEMMYVTMPTSLDRVYS